MLVTVIKAFPFSTDGLNSQTALPGEREIPAALVPGLIADGYVCPEGHEPVAMTPHRRKSIADRIIDLFRAHIDALTDEALLEYAASADRQAAREADDRSDQAAADPIADDGSAGPAEGGTQPAPEAAVADDAAPVGLWDVHYVSPHGQWFTDKGLTREAADARSAELQQGDEPSPSVRIEPHAPPANLTDADLVEAMNEAELRAYLTKRDGKAPHHKLSPASLLKLAKGE